MRAVWRIGFKAVLVVVVLVAVAVTVIYFWPHRSPELPAERPESLSYAQAREAVREHREADVGRGVVNGCLGRALTHGEAAKGVGRLHGIRVCPSRFEELATYFLDRGYNICIPVAPAHGTAANQNHAAVEAAQLVDYLKESVTIATGLGGGDRRGGTLRRGGAGYLGCTPPARGGTSPAALGFLSTLPGASTGLVTALLGDPLRISPPTGPVRHHHRSDRAGFLLPGTGPVPDPGDNYHENPSGLSLKSIGTVISGDDGHINKELAESIPRATAGATGLDLLPHHIRAEWEADQEILNSTSPAIRNHGGELFRLYLDFYEGDPGARE